MLGKAMLWAAGIGAILNILNGPKPANPVGAALVFAALAVMIWYPVKAVLICSQTAIRFKKEGRPLFEAGGLTEYDTEKCRQIGEAMARANRRNSGD